MSLIDPKLGHFIKMILNQSRNKIIYIYNSCVQFVGFKNTLKCKCNECEYKSNCSGLLKGRKQSESWFNKETMEQGLFIVLSVVV